MAGYAKLYRKLVKSDLWLAEPFTRGQAWVDLIMLAAFKSGWLRIRGVRVDYQRGQYATSLCFLSTRWSWSKGKVSRFISELETDRQISTQKNNVSTVITITNYDAYQDGGTADGTADSTTSDTANGPQTGPQTVQQTDRIKEGEEGKEGRRRKKKGENPPNPPQPVELPASIRNEAMQSAVDDWLAYKAERGESYRPTGLKGLLTRLATVASMHGEAGVIDQIRKAIGSGWKGWEHDDPPARGSPRNGRDPRGVTDALTQYLGPDHA